MVRRFTLCSSFGSLCRLAASLKQQVNTAPEPTVKESSSPYVLRIESSSNGDSAGPFHRPNHEPTDYV